MKKYISFIAIALVALLTSCSNDDITIGRGITFKLDPAGVVASYPEEWAGELTTFDAGFKLRTRILVYDSNGLLVAQESAYLPNYKTEMSCSKTLPTGSYTIIATSDLVSESGYEFWTLKGEGNISTAQLSTSELSFGGKYRILGLCSQKVTISENTQNIMLALKSTGALLRMKYYNVHAFNNVKYYGLLANRACSSMTFDEDGTPNMQPYTSPDGKLDVLCSFVDVDNAEGDNLYAWYFLFPIDNITFQFVWEDADEIDYDMGDQFTIPSVKVGEEWLVEVDCVTDEVGYSIYTPNSSRSQKRQVSQSAPMMLKKDGQIKSSFGFSSKMNQVKLKDFIQH